MTTFTPELTTRLRELLAANAKCDSTPNDTKEHWFDSGPYCGGCQSRRYEEDEALECLLDHIEAQDRRIAELRSALGRIAFEDQPSYLSCPSTPFCSPGRSHDEFCGVGIAQAALEGQL